MSSVSIVVLTFNRRVELMRNLARQAALPGRHAIVVVDNGCTDGTAEAVEKNFPSVRLVRTPRNLGAAGRNLGVDAVRTDYVAFSDDDTCWEAGALERAAEILDADPEVGVLNARILVGPEGRLDAACAAMERSPLPGSAHSGGPGLTGFMAGACVMRADVFRRAGGYWAPFFIGGEETLLSLDILDLGWRIVYAPQVVTRHFPSSLRDVGQRRRLLARNAVWTAWLRLPWREAWQVTAKEFATRGSMVWKASLLWHVLCGMPRIMAKRKLISPEVGRLRLLADR